TILGNAQLDTAHRGSHRIGPYLAVGLDAEEDRALGHAVELFDVDAERSVEIEDVGADRLASGIGDADAAHAQRVLERAEDEQVAEPIEQAIDGPHFLAIENAAADALRQRHEATEEPTLHRARILHADHHLGEDVLPDAGWREEIGRAELA